MRSAPLFVALVAAISCSIAGIAHAQVDPQQAELAAARRALAVAKIEARHYWQVEYQNERRELNAAIEITDAEVQSLRRQLRTLAPFRPFAYGQEPWYGLRDARLCLKDAEIRYRALIDQRNNLVRFHSDRQALLELRVAEARALVVALEGGGEIALDVIQPE
jgi:hypothetical protein